MKFVSLPPQRDFHTTGMLNCFKGAPPIPITRYSVQGAVCQATYHRASLWTRIKFLFCGRIFVSMYGKNATPVVIGVGQLFKKGKGKN